MVVALRPKSPFLTFISELDPVTALTLEQPRSEQNAMFPLSDIKTIQGAKESAFRNWEIF
jgi:hypothetical protein